MRTTTVIGLGLALLLVGCGAGVPGGHRAVVRAGKKARVSASRHVVYVIPADSIQAVDWQGGPNGLNQSEPIPKPGSPVYGYGKVPAKAVVQYGFDNQGQGWQSASSITLKVGQKLEIVQPTYDSLATFMFMGPHTAATAPEVLLSWRPPAATEGIPRVFDLTAIAPGHVVMTLMAEPGFWQKEMNLTITVEP